MLKGLQKFLNKEKTDTESENDKYKVIINMGRFSIYEQKEITNC